MERSRKEIKPFPTLLTAADALSFAADKLESLVGDLQLMSIFKEYLEDDKTLENQPGLQEKFRDVRVLLKGVVDTPLQEKAMKQAAEMIRELAQDLKLRTAREQQRN
jgi:hypothetical protein